MVCCLPRLYLFPSLHTHTRAPVHTHTRQSKAKQKKAKQSKAKQSKAKQSKTKHQPRSARRRDKRLENESRGVLVLRGSQRAAATQDHLLAQPGEKEQRVVDAERQSDARLHRRRKAGDGKVLRDGSHDRVCQRGLREFRVLLLLSRALWSKTYMKSRSRT